MIWYFVRHGETEWNKQRLFQGATDIPLDDTGRDQAREAAQRLLKHGISFQRVYSSPLDRAQETAELVSGIARSEFHVDERIKEMYFGSLEGTDYHEAKTGHALLFNDPVHYVPQCGEEPYDVILARTGSFLEDLAKNEMDGEGSILIQTHGACMRALLTNLRKGELQNFWSINVGNCEFFKFRAENGVITELDASDINVNSDNNNI